MFPRERSGHRRTAVTFYLFTCASTKLIYSEPSSVVDFDSCETETKRNIQTQRQGVKETQRPTQRHRNTEGEGERRTQRHRNTEGEGERRTQRHRDRRGRQGQTDRQKTDRQTEVNLKSFSSLYNALTHLVKSY